MRGQRFCCDSVRPSFFLSHLKASCAPLMLLMLSRGGWLCAPDALTWPPSPVNSPDDEGVSDAEPGRELRKGTGLAPTLLLWKWPPLLPTAPEAIVRPLELLCDNRPAVAGRVVAVALLRANRWHTSR